MHIRAVLALLLLSVVACRGEPGSSPAAPPTTTPEPTHPPALRAAPASPSPVRSPSPAVSPAPVARALTYVAIGASDTVGVGAANPTTDGWVPRLGRLLGPGTRVENLGVSGTLLRSALAEQLPRAIKEQPDLVTVWLAVNDMNAQVPLDRYSADLGSLFQSLQQQTRARVLVANVPDLTLVPAYRDADTSLLKAQISRWNAAIADLARRHNATVVDLHAEYAELAAHPEYISGDGFHPSSAGYARIADLFFAASKPS